MPPIRVESISLSPLVSTWRWIEEASFSIRSGGTGRLRQAMAIERSSLARSKDSRRLADFTTVRSRSWTRSKVVKRAPQSSHWRRRRIEAPSSLGRLSFTWLFSWEQKGQRMRRLAGPAAQGGDAGADHCAQPDRDERHRD